MRIGGLGKDEGMNFSCSHPAEERRDKENVGDMLSGTKDFSEVLMVVSLKEI